MGWQFRQKQQQSVVLSSKLKKTKTIVDTSNWLMHQRVVEMIISSAESEYKIQKQAKHAITVRLFVFWVLISLLREQKDLLFCGQHNEMILRTFKIQMQNEREIPNNHSQSIVFNWDTSSFLVDFAFKFFAFYPMFEFYDKLSSHSLCLRTHLISKKHNLRVDINKNFVELLPCLQTFLLFLRICSWWKNSRRRSQQWKPKK